VLKQEAADRASDAPLLTRADGSGWGHSRTRHHRNDFRAVIEAAGLDPDEVTLYALCRENPASFASLLAKVLTAQVRLQHDNTLTVALEDLKLVAKEMKEVGLSPEHCRRHRVLPSLQRSRASSPPALPHLRQNDVRCDAWPTAACGGFQ